ncbi:MAG TPA: hypothetical protein VIQ03_10405 [Gammaproteobacteria bacterium]
MKYFMNIVCVSLLFISGNSYAMLVNGSFENYLRGWETIGYVSKTSQWSSQGDYSAVIIPTVSLSKIESELGLDRNTLYVIPELANPESTQSVNASIIFQSFVVNEGDRINVEFDVAGTPSRNNWNHAAIVFLQGGVLSGYYSLSSLVTTTNVFCPCDCESMTGIFNASNTGIATIGFMVFKDSDFLHKPSIKLDNINASITAVPIPSTIWLFGSGLISLLGLIRNYKSKILRVNRNNT